MEKQTTYSSSLSSVAEDLFIELFTVSDARGCGERTLFLAHTRELVSQHF